jgi:hypothetical protein
VGRGRKRYGCCWIFWPLCVFGCISYVIVEGACVSDCRGLGGIYGWYSRLVSGW